MVIKLYLDFVSQPARAVYTLCRIKEIPIEMIETRLNKKQHKEEWFKKINPMMKVPAIEDTDEPEFALSESHAIMRYLSRKYCKNAPYLYPVDNVVKIAKIDQYLDFHHTNTRKLTNYISNTVFATRLNTFDKSYDVEKGKNEVELVLNNFTNIYLKKSTYICGEEITIADLSAFFEIHFLNLIGYNFDKKENLGKWMKKMQEIKEVQEANFTFCKILPKLVNLDFKI